MKMYLNKCPFISRVRSEDKPLVKWKMQQLGTRFIPSPCVGGGLGGADSGLFGDCWLVRYLLTSSLLTFVATYCSLKESP